MTTATMEYMREDMAAGKLTPHQINAAISEAAHLFLVWQFRDPVLAWDYAQFVADAHRCLLSEREVG